MDRHGFMRHSATQVGFTIGLAVVLGCSDNIGPLPLGSINGSIASPERGPLDGVTVAVTPGGKIDRTIAGHYDIDLLGAGQYTVALGTLPAGCVNPGSKSATVTDTTATTVDFTVSCSK